MMTPSEIERLQTYLRKLFGSERINIVAPSARDYQLKWWLMMRRSGRCTKMLTTARRLFDPSDRPGGGSTGGETVSAAGTSACA